MSLPFTNNFQTEIAPMNISITGRPGSAGLLRRANTP